MTGIGITRVPRYGGVLCLALACGDAHASREEVLRNYIDAVNRNDVSGALAYHTPNAEFIIPGQTPIRGTTALRSLLQWDSVLGSRIRFFPVEWQGDTLIVGTGSEWNKWFAGIGMDSVTYLAGTRFTFSGDRISGIYPSTFDRPSLEAFDRHLGPFMRWAAIDAPGEVDGLMRDGQFRYTGDAALRWLALFERYAGRDRSIP